MGRTVPLQLALRPSAILTAFLFCGHGLALVVVCLLALELWLRLGLALLLLFSLGYQWRAIWRPEVLALRTGPDSILALAMEGDIWLEGEVEGQSVMLPWLILLRVRLVGQRRPLSLVLPSDALGQEGHRLLRRWLLWLSQSGRHPQKIVEPESAP